MVYDVKVSNVSMPFGSLSLYYSLDFPNTFKFTLPNIENVQINDIVDIYYQDSLIFSGYVEKKTPKVSESGVTLEVEGRDKSQLLMRFIYTGSRTWSSTQCIDIINTILSGSGITTGSVDPNISAYHLFEQTTDDDFNVDNLSNTMVSGTGTAAKVVLGVYTGSWSQTTDTDFNADTLTNAAVSGSGTTACVAINNTTGNVRSVAFPSTNIVRQFNHFNATTTLHGGAATYDVLDSSNNIIGGYSGITTAQLPYDISGINPVTYKTIKLRSNLSTTASSLVLWVTTGSLVGTAGMELREDADWRAGQRITGSNKYVGRVTFYISKSGTPTGTGNVRIRKVSDGSILVDGPSEDVSTLPTTYTFQDYNFTSFPLINEAVRIMYEFSGSSNAVNHVDISLRAGNVCEGCRTEWLSGSGYIDTNTHDCDIKIYEIRFPRLEDWIAGLYSGSYSGSITSTALTPTNLISWDSVDCTRSLNGETFSLCVVNSANQTIAGHSTVTTFPHSISDLSAGSYATLKLSGSFTSSSYNSAELDSWAMSYTSDSMDFSEDYGIKWDSIKQFIDILGYEKYVTPTGLMNVSAMLGKTGSQHFEFGINCLELSREYDAYQLANVINVIGYGTGSDRIERHFVDNTSIASYNERHLVNIDKSLTTNIMADSKGHVLLNQRTNPVERIILQTLPSFIDADNLDPGDSVYVKDPKTSMEGYFRIKSIRRDYSLSGGTTFTFEVTNRYLLLYDYLSKIDKVESWNK